MERAAGPHLSFGPPADRRGRPPMGWVIPPPRQGRNGEREGARAPHMGTLSISLVGQ